MKPMKVQSCFYGHCPLIRMHLLLQVIEQIGQGDVALGVYCCWNVYAFDIFRPWVSNDEISCLPKGDPVIKSARITC